MGAYQPEILWGGVAVLVFHFVLWGVFEKAGRPGWWSIVPGFNAVALTDIVGRSHWWAVAVFVPGLNVAAFLRLAIDLARSFGKTPRFGVALFVFSVVLAPVLAFGSATYVGPAAARVAHK